MFSFLRKEHPNARHRLLTLPADVLRLALFRNASPLDALHRLQVCKRFKEVGDHDEVWREYFDVNDLWAQQEHEKHHSWRLAYVAWLKRKAMLARVTALTWDEEPRQRLPKMLVVGHAAAGKSCIVFRICRKPHRRTHLVTEGADSEGEHALTDAQNNSYNFKIIEWRVGNPENRRRMKHSAQLVTFVYDVRKPEELASIPQFFESEQHATEDLSAIYIVGAHIDLCSGFDRDSEEQKQLRETHTALVEKKFPETLIRWHYVSSKTGEGVDEFRRMCINIVCNHPRVKVPGAEAKRAIEAYKHAHTPWYKKVSQAIA